MLMKSFSFHKTAASLLAVGVFLCGSMPACAAHRKVRKQVKPVYPELAKRMDIKGTVWVEATVAPSGEVLGAKAVRGNSLLASAAEEAVRKWKFAAGNSRSQEKV